MKNKRGITLIALIISIIVLVILAGVTVATITGENGLLSKAQLAKEKNIEAEQDEKNKIDKMADEIDFNSVRNESDEINLLKEEIKRLKKRLDKFDNWEKIGTVTISNGTGEININKKYTKIKIYMNDSGIEKIPIESTNFELQSDNTLLAGGITFSYKNLNNSALYSTYFIATQTNDKITFTKTGFDNGATSNATLRTFTTDVYGIPD